MKKLIYLFTILLFSSTCMVSCIPEEDAETFDETLLYGEWQSETVYYKYISDGTGITWDTADDVTEDEAQGFTWTLSASELTHIHIIEIGGSVPKVYTVTKLTFSSLVYEDSFGKIYSFSKN